MKRIFIIAAAVVILILVLAGLSILGTHSGATRAQITEALPGDEIIPHPWISIDRAATLPVSKDVAWPWVIQIGKDRAGWYAPRWLEDTLNKHAASSTLPQFQNLSVGDIVPDWGGGSLKVLALVPNSYVLYGSIHGNATSTYEFTWALVLEDDTPTSSSFHLRLRIQSPTSWARYIPASIPGLIDYATDVVMFDGLKERLRN
jgi:hypothetical protein